MDQRVDLPTQGEAAADAADETPVHLTAIAIEKVRERMQREGISEHGLRVGVGGGGCSGLQYQLAFEERPRDGDLVLAVEPGVRVFIDRESLEHLRGVTLDYVTALHGGGFKFVNPNASRTCGCGSSFAK